MHQMNLQFHATKKEILGFVSETAKKYELNIYGILVFPEFSFGELSPDDLDDTIHYTEIILSKNKLLFLDYKEYKNYLFERKGDLFVEPGIDDGSILSESSMGALSNDEIDPLWKKIRRQFTKGLLKGAYVANWQGRWYYPNHWYSEGARKLYQQGVCIKPIAGNTHYELESIE